MKLQNYPLLEISFIQQVGYLLWAKHYRNFWKHRGRKIKHYSCLHETYSLVRRADIYEMIPKFLKNDIW